MRINPTAKYLILFAGAITLFFWKTLLSKQFTSVHSTELVNYNYTWNRFWVDSLRHGHVPLWDPYAFAGRPFAAEMLPSAFYPLHLPFLLVPFDSNGLFSQSLYQLTRAAAHLLGAWLMFALLRDFRLSRFASTIGAFSFALSVMMTNMLWLPFVEAAIWLPAIFLFLVRALRAENIRQAVLQATLGGLCFGLSLLTGGLHFSILQGIVIVSAAICYGLAAPHAPLSRRAHLSSTALVLLVVLGVGAGASAVQMLPSYEYGKLSIRFIDGGPISATQKIPYDRMHGGMWAQSIITVLFPYGFQGNYAGGERWPVYIGTLPFFLAITAIWRCWGNLWVRYLTGLATFAFAYTVSQFFPLHGVIYAIVPYLWVMRVPGRLVYLALFALAVLAAFGAEKLLETDQTSWTPARTVMKWVAIGSAVMMLIPGLLGDPTLNSWNALSLTMVATSCFLYIYFTRNKPGQWFRFIVVVFLLLDLNSFNWLEKNKATSPEFMKLTNQLVSLRGTADFIKSQPGLGRVRIDLDEPPNIGDAYGVQYVFGGGGTMLKTFERLWWRNDMMNVRYTVKLASVADPDPVYQDADWKVYENPGIFPRAWVVHETIVEESQGAALDRAQVVGTDFLKVAYLEKPLSQSIQADSSTADQVTFRAYEADRMAIDVNAGQPGLLVLSELHYPGWRATVNGNDAEIYRVNGGLRGVIVPNGTSQVVLEYAPMSIYLGAVISVITFLGAFVFIFISRRQLRMPEPSAAGSSL